MELLGISEGVLALDEGVAVVARLGGGAKPV